jgi:isopropylmalate/homocitrate/citramalate synthase
MTPFVGDNFNMTRAGIHADGLMKDAEIYNIFDTEKILNKSAVVAISNTSGTAGVAYWINNYFGLKGDKILTKSSKLVINVKEAVDREYSGGRTTLMGDDELLSIIRNIDPEFIKNAEE